MISAMYQQLSLRSNCGRRLGSLISDMNTVTVFELHCVYCVFIIAPPEPSRPLRPKGNTDNKRLLALQHVDPTNGPIRLEENYTQLLSTM